MHIISKIFILPLFIGFVAAASDVRKEDIKGVWLLADHPKQVNYPEIIFEDETAVFLSMADTIYRFQYQIIEDDLILKDLKGNSEKAHIVLLTDSLLVFKTLRENQTEQKYTKVKAEE